ncbi:hypothetical protein HDU76_009493, partial [Blyttiomyces sp. JEL0837]
NNKFHKAINNPTSTSNSKSNLNEIFGSSKSSKLQNGNAKTGSDIGGFEFFNPGLPSARKINNKNDYFGEEESVHGFHRNDGYGSGGFGFNGNGGVNGKKSNCQSDLTAFEDDMNSCAPDVLSSGDFSGLTSQQADCICAGKVQKDVTAIINDCDKSVSDSAVSFQSILSDFCSQPASPSSAGGSSCDSDLAVFENDVDTCVPGFISGTKNYDYFTDNQKKCLCQGSVGDDLNMIISDCNSTIVDSAKKFKSQFADMCKSLNSGSSDTATCDNDLSKLQTDMDTCVPGMFTGDTNSTLTTKQIQCLCSDKISKDLTVVLKD